jgi:Tfp pilus assembly protein PilV
MTLIETLITIVILSLALLALSGMQVSAFHISKNSNQLTTAMISTQDTIELLMSIDFNHASLIDSTPPGESTGYELETALNIAPPPGVHVNWTVDDQAGSMKLVNITTTWLDRGVEKSISLPLRRTSFQ